MFKAKISADILRDSIKSISSIVDEAKFKITDSGIHVRAVDPANVAMVSLELTSAAFDSFEATELELGIDLVRLIDALDMAERNASVIMEFNKETHKLQLGIGGLSYTLALLDPSTIRKEPKVPQLNLATSVKIDGTTFKRLVKAAEKVGEYITLGIKGDSFYMEAEGDTDRVRFEMTREEVIDIVPGESRSLYSLDYLTSISKAVSASTELTIELSIDYPVNISFNLAEGKGSVKYLLAPRIESE